MTGTGLWFCFLVDSEKNICTIYEESGLFYYGTKFNLWMKTFNNFFLKINNIDWRSKRHCSLIAIWPQSTVLCLFFWMFHYHTIKFASFFKSHSLPMETSQHPLPQANKLCYGKENRPLDLYLDATLIWGQPGATRLDLCAGDLWTSIAFPVTWFLIHRMASKMPFCNLHFFWP